jgi:hypothetical protein
MTSAKAPDSQSLDIFTFNYVCWFAKINEPHKVNALRIIRDKTMFQILGFNGPNLSRVILNTILLSYWVDVVASTSPWIFIFLFFFNKS